MERLKKQVINVTTGEELIVDYTDEEMVQWEADKAEFDLLREQQEAATAAKEALKTSAKEKLVAGQPLTEEEAATLVI
jgi:hypothetical protein